MRGSHPSRYPGKPKRRNLVLDPTLAADHNKELEHLVQKHQKMNEAAQRLKKQDAWHRQQQQQNWYGSLAPPQSTSVAAPGDDQSSSLGSRAGGSATGGGTPSA